MSILLKEFDLKYYKDGIKYLAGVDEAGRGPIAGPVVAAAVIFKQEDFIQEINDSKKLSESKRKKLFNFIISNAVAYSYAVIDNVEIDRINILQASLKAMQIACDKLLVVPDLILIDGNKGINYPIQNIPIVKGDAKSFSIAAASIIAKVIRDEIMVKESVNYPQYNWAKNKGYPTKEHFEAVFKYGITKLHRNTFLKKYTKLIPINF